MKTIKLKKDKNYKFETYDDSDIKKPVDERIIECAKRNKGKIITCDFNLSKKAQISWRGDLPLGMAPEGESTFVSVKGHVADVIHELTGGIRSGMSYVNAVSIEEIKQKAHFMEMSANGISESRAHGLR